MTPEDASVGVCLAIDVSSEENRIVPGGSSSARLSNRTLRCTTLTSIPPLQEKLPTKTLANKSVIDREQGD